jgi:cysteine desulfurase family protein (TIGR01976 family)
MTFDIAAVRSRFPALRRTLDGRPVAYLDGPGGTQVVDGAIAAMTGVMEAGGANHGGLFVTGRESDATVEAARAAIADFFNAAGPDEIAFGQNMTSITLSVSRALAWTWQPGDEVVVTRLDHDANVWPWVLAARDADATVRFVDFDPEAGCVLDPASLQAAIGPRTRLVAVTHASNAVGTVVDVAAVARMAHDVGALVYVDAVHVAPHRRLDVQAIDADFAVASVYKFYGPHTGVFYGRHALLESLEAVRIRPAPNTPPGKWETGTQSFESLAGVTAAVDYLASLGEGSQRRERLTSAMQAVVSYEATLAERFLAGVAEMPGVTLFGRSGTEGRTPTFGVEVEGFAPAEVARRLGEQGIFVWHGDYYAVEVMERLGRADRGGLVRVGFVHYNTPAEVDRVLDALDRLAAGAGR